MLECTREMIRVLKPSGSLWVNLGDKYAGYAGDTGGKGKRVSEDGYHYRAGKSDAAHTVPNREAKYTWGGVRGKSLMGLPWRYAIRCIDDLGLILRAEVIWLKPNGLPESVTDRVRKSHEQWFHFTLQPQYYSAIDEIREGWKNTHRDYNPLGKVPGSVWSIPSEPLKIPAELGIDHFAAFPTEWPRRIILGWSPPGICVECGEGRRPVVDASYDRQGRTTNGPQSLARRHESPGRDVRAVRRTAITGYACGCPEPTAPTRPAIVLDPFGGTGTVALVASALGRVGVSVDRSADYNRLAQWRVNDPGERAKALRLPKPPPVTNGQQDLFSAPAFRPGVKARAGGPAGPSVP